MHVSRLSVAGDVPCVPPTGVYLLTIKALPPWLQFGTLGVGLYLLFVAFTFYKGMTAGPAPPPPLVWLFQLTHCYTPLLSHVDLRASQICAQIHARL